MTNTINSACFDNDPRPSGFCSIIFAPFFNGNSKSRTRQIARRLKHLKPALPVGIFCQPRTA